MATEKIKTIEAQNQFTAWAPLGGLFQVFIDGVTDSTVTFQGTPDSGVSIYDLETFSGASAGGMHVGQVALVESWKYRVGVKTGEFADESILVRLEA